VTAAIAADFVASERERGLCPLSLASKKTVSPSFLRYAFEFVRFDERHSLFVDEEGLRDGLTAFTIFEGYPQPLAGKIVLVGGDGREPYTSPMISLEDAAAHFKCCRPVLDPVFATNYEMTAGGLIISGALMGLQVRIDRRAPSFVEGEA
jgi:hypothetical protein